MGPASRPRPTLAWAGLAILGACTPVHHAGPAERVAAPVASSAQTFRGIYRFGFEISTFEGCWLNMFGEPWATFERSHPEIAETRNNGGTYEYEILFEGARREGEPAGHMGLYRCQYDVTRLLETRRVPPRP